MQNYVDLTNLRRQITKKNIWCFIQAKSFLENTKKQNAL